MEDIDRFKVYSAMAETSRKWVSVMDAKAGFLSALNAATMAFVWTNAKLADTHGCVHYVALTSTVILLFSLFFALRTVLPKVNLRHAFGQKLNYTNGYEPVSFFGHVAENYPSEKHTQFISIVDGMDIKALTREALEQHYTICHVIQKKSSGIAWSGWIWLTGAMLVIVALIIKG